MDGILLVIVIGLCFFPDSSVNYCDALQCSEAFGAVKNNRHLLVKMLCLERTVQKVSLLFSKAVLTNYC